MTETVITLVGKPLLPAAEKQAVELIKEITGSGLRLDPLHAGYALDIFTPVFSPDLITRLYQKLSTLPAIDIFIQPNNGARRKKLLVADMDATIIQQETLDELAAHFNLKDKIEPITAKAMRGEIGFHEALTMRVKLLKGLPVSALHKTMMAVSYSPGADVLVKSMRRADAKCILVSGGFDLFTNHVATTLGFHKNFGNQLAIEDNKLTGDVIPPILDKDAKVRHLTEQAKIFNCTLDEVISIGDGANDIPMLKKAGIGVGYFGKPAVIEATPYQIRHTDLISVLYLQGYRQHEIANG